MSGYDVGLAMFGGVLAMLVLRVPVAVAMLVSGAVGYAAILGVSPLLANLKTLTFSRFSSYTLSIIPLFLLMGEFATRSGMNASLFGAARAWLGHRPGGLAMATIGGCAAFGALCGSSIATAATMSHVAGPEMRRHGYSGALTTGTLAGGGTLGILIPPSVILVIYTIYTEQSIGALFVAAIVPGLLAVAGYMAVVRIYVAVAPGAARAAPRMGWAERWAASRDVWPAAAVFLPSAAGRRRTGARWPPRGRRGRRRRIARRPARRSPAGAPRVPPTLTTPDAPAASIRARSAPTAASTWTSGAMAATGSTTSRPARVASNIAKGGGGSRRSWHRSHGPQRMPIRGTQTATPRTAPSRSATASAAALEMA